MKRMHDTTRITELFIKVGLVAAIAATLLLPTSIKADAAAPALQSGSPMVETAQRIDAIPLPPIPNLGAIPWLTLQRARKGPQIDTLLLRGPAVLQSASSARDRLPSWMDRTFANANPEHG
jgi:hypothetical protein